MSNPLHNAKTPAHDLGSIRRDAANELRAAGIAAPELDARLLICNACGISHEQFAASPERDVSANALKKIRDAVKRRCDREPVSRILGVREFWGLDFAIGPETLDPRPDTETLVAAALEVAREAGAAPNPAILDMGTGSGCILVSLLHEIKNATGLATDVSRKALVIARANATRHAVDGRAQFLCACWNEGIARKFNLVTANPPYIPSRDIEDLEPEVARYDPLAALDGGPDGLDAYRQAVPALRGILAPGGWALFEAGDGQAPALKAMLQNMPGEDFFEHFREWTDLEGRVRCVAAKRSPTL